MSLAAALAQTWGDLRIVVIADDGRDAARRTFDHLVVGAPGALFVETERTHGFGDLVKQWWIERSEAEFMCFLDDDDWRPPVAVEEMLAPLLENAGVVMSVSQMFALVTQRSGRVGRHRIVAGRLAANHIGNGSILFRTAAAKGFPATARYAVDFERCQYIAARGEVVYIPHPLYWYNGWRGAAEREELFRRLNGA